MAGKTFKQTLTGMLVGIGLLSATTVSATPVAWDAEGKVWLSQQSEHFSVHFVDGHQQSAAKALDIAERVHREMKPYFQSAPEERTEMVLVDDFDFSNGWATPLPFAQIRLFMSPPEDGGDLATSDDWLHMLIRHEYAHIMHMELSTGVPKALQHIFGRQGFFFPHALTPSLLLEGLAVYLETNKELGYGRLQSSQYAMKMRMEVATGELKDLDQVAVADREWPLGYKYLYGAYFIEYLTLTYGEEKVQQFLQSYSRRIIPYFLIHRTARQTFGKDFDTLWQDFQSYLETEFSPQLAQLQQQSVTGKDLQLTPFLQVVSASEQGLLVNRNNGDDRPEILILSPEQAEWQSVTASKNITAMASHPQSGLAVSRIVHYADGRSYNDLFVFRDGGWQQLTERQRFRTVRWMPDGNQLIASRKVAGVSELWLLDAEPSGESVRIWRGDLETVLGNFDISPTGKDLVAAVKRPRQGWNLEKLDLITHSWTALTDTKASESSPTYLPDGRITYSADYDGVFNIYVFDEHRNQVEQWTRETGGAFQPVWQPDAGLVYQAYESQGYQLRYLAEPEVLSTQSIEDLQGRYNYPPAVDLTAEKNEPEPYSPWSTLRPHNWLPLIFADDVRTQLGALTFGSDALGRHSYQLTATWDVDNELADFNAVYSYDNRWLFTLNSSHSFDKLTFDNDSGYRITRDDYMLVQRSHILTAFEDQLSLHAGGILDKESLVSQPDFARMIAYKESNETLAGLALTYDNREAYLNVPGIGWGHYLDVVAETNELFNSDFEGQKYQAQWKGTWDLPGRMTLTARLGGGYADDEAKSFRLGGNDLIEESRLFGRDIQALRGYDESAQRGHRYATQRLELKTWLTRFERNWSLYPVGLGDLSGSVFVDSGAAWDSGDDIKQLTGAGVQMTLEAKLGYNLTLPVTLGYAYGFDDEEGKDQVYLSVSGSF
ncbi:hypothetical protein MD588_06095 [Photobacterium sp. SDRW27]|uniref:hypothetical protein n=1 Tax=Photobacterium obscurum TaxID=2829490 RepID=UPI0022437B37|nr:hypothetical protein [Photobacterium obscurum]MCW8328375.1 hypothetical protein [Photobacterium obscurum]